ncbi:ABC transporter ATP-binding protein [Azonexus fungiphilus]|uniref:ABC transporter ATP-binding protein n=1 Tax=Azonexus fungiphilus TaxID=146940 RepID=UPI00156AF98D|nr:ABC transporter ATP-binding protein [Azonexus fungiphilus]NHC05219.1 ABC transporter ATP-binding protein [Azonexus fungiphilus]
MSFVTFENVSLAYAPGGANAIEDVSLNIREGEFVAVVGPSGCGKSTLMKLVSGLKPPSNGYVFVDGREVGGPLKIVGMAFQAANLLPWRSTLDNVMLPLEIVEPFRSNLKKEKARYTADAEALLARVGLAGYGDKFPWELSGGMQQRASICRALIHQPRLLMLDEPFGALDAFTREELWCMLRDLWQEKPFTVILVTHDLREAVFLADAVYVMSKRPGRILVRKEIDLPRPRPLDVTYTDTFAAYVHELREHIGRIRES